MWITECTPAQTKKRCQEKVSGWFLRVFSGASARQEDLPDTFPNPVFEKQTQTHHTPIQDVIRKTRLRDAWRPSHALIPPEPPARSRKSS